MHLHEIDVHEERLVVLCVLLDVVDRVVSLPHVKISEVIVRNIFASLCRLARYTFPLIHIHDIEIRFRDLWIVRGKPWMKPLRGVRIRVDARIIGGECLHFIEAMLNWIRLWLVAEMPLARKVR